MWLDRGNSCKHRISSYSFSTHLGCFCKWAHTPHKTGQRPSFGNLGNEQSVKFLETHSTKLLIIYFNWLPRCPMHCLVLRIWKSSIELRSLSSTVVRNVLYLLIQSHFASRHFDNSCVLFNYVHKSTPLDGCSILINITKCPVQCKTTFLTLGWMWILVSRSLVCLCFSLYFNFYALLSLCICSLSLLSLGIFHHQYSLFVVCDRYSRVQLIWDVCAEEEHENVLSNDLIRVKLRQ